MTRQFPPRHNGVPATPTLSPQIACATVHAIEAIDKVGLDNDSRTRALAGVVAEHVGRFPNREQAMAQLAMIATALAMGAKP